MMSPWSLKDPLEPEPTRQQISDQDMTKVAIYLLRT